MTQNEKVMALLERGEVTQRDAYGEGIMRLASRINELRKAGVDIDTEMRTVLNRDGTKTKIAVYTKCATN